MTKDPNRGNPTAVAPPVHRKRVSLRMRRALLVSLPLAAAAAGIVYCCGVAPQYRAACWFRVNLNREYVAFPLEPWEDEVPRFAESQIELVRSPLVLDPVVRNEAVARHLAALGANEPMEWLSHSLAAQLVGGLELLEISLECPSAQAGKDIVEAVADSYRQAYERDTDLHRQQVIQLLEEEKNRAAQQVERRREDVRMQSRLALGVDPFAVGPSEQTDAESDVINGRAKQLEDALLHLAIALDIARSGLHRMALRHGVKDEEFKPTQERIEDYVAHDYHVAELTRQIADGSQESTQRDAEGAPAAGLAGEKPSKRNASLEEQLRAARRIARQNAVEDLQFDHWRELLQEQSPAPGEELLDQHHAGTAPRGRQTTIATTLETTEADGNEEEILGFLRFERATARHQQSLGRVEAFDAAVALVRQVRDDRDACQRALTNVKSDSRVFVDPRAR